MGNCCCHRDIENDLSYIKGLDDYLKCVLENLKRIQDESMRYSKNNKESKLTFEREQFYIVYGNLLLKMKIVLEDYYFYEKNKEANPTTPVGETEEDFATHYEVYKGKKFDLDSALQYLQKVLDCEKEGEKEEIEHYDNILMNSLFCKE